MRCEPYEPIPNMRWIECPSCNGDLGWETEPYGYCRETGAPLTYWRACSCSNGSILEECPLITEDELMEIP